jgi:hypothetical protein
MVPVRSESSGLELLGEVRCRWPLYERAVGRESGAVAGALPRSIGCVPADDAAKVRAAS